VQLAVMDNASDNSQAAALTAQLAGDKSIPVGITPTYQPNFNAACARANAAGFPMVSAQSGPPDPKNNPRGWCWTMTTDPVAQATYTFQTLKGRRGGQGLGLCKAKEKGNGAFKLRTFGESAKAAEGNLQGFAVAAGPTALGP